MKHTAAALVVLAAAAFAKTPDVPAFDKILQKSIEKTTTPPPPPPSLKMPPTPPPLSMPGMAQGAGVNVIGTMIIGSRKTAWLIGRDNKVMRATEGVVIDGKKLTRITPYGADYAGEGEKGFLPVMTSIVNESDIVFSTREAQPMAGQPMAGH